jgi:hypothetical protein
VDVGLTRGGERTAARHGRAAGSRFPRGFRRHPRILWGASLATAGIVLYFCYLRQAQTYELNSDPAGQALQAWQMWHGNPLLRGWWLGDISFYGVELPLNVLIEKVGGLRADDVHILAALVYTAVVLLTALLARGTARGREGVVRALLAGGILLAPSLVYGTRVLMQGPDHTGTMIPVLLVLLVLDRVRERWWVPVVVGVLLTWAQVNDPLATFAAAAAIGVACAARICLGLARGAQPARTWWYDASLAVAAAISLGLAHLILAKIHAIGGFYVPPPKHGYGIASVSALPAQTRVTGSNILMLFGADVTSEPTAVSKALAGLHLAGLALGLWGLLAGLRGFAGREADRVTQALVAGTILVLAAGEFGNYMFPVIGAHEIVSVLPFSAVLAGRLLGGRLARARLEPVLAVGLACYLGGLAYNDTQPIAAPAHQDLADWLVAHHLTDGLAGYWESNIVTLDSGGQVRVASLIGGGTTAQPYESDSAWFDPAISRANFIVSVSFPPADVPVIKPTVVRARFGPPARTYHFREYTVMVYNYNLLTRVRMPSLGGFQRLPVRSPLAYQSVAMYFVSVNSSSPSCAPSRPMPDCLTPPNGAAGSDTRPRFSPIMPASSASLTRSPRRRSRVYT